PDVEAAGEWRGADAIGVDTDLRERVRHRHQQAEDADRARDRGRFGPDLVAGHRDPVAATRGDVAHRDHYGLALLAREREVSADQYGGVRVAAGRVHAQHDRVHGIVLARGAHEVGGRLAADHAGRTFAGHDFALRDHHRDFRARVRQVARTERAEVLAPTDLAEAVTTVGLAERGDLRARFRARRELVDELLVEREAREVARIVVDLRVVTRDVVRDR